MRRGRLVAWSIVFLIALGCGGNSQSVTPTKQPELKELLERVAETGTLEDLGESISTQIEELEETNPAKANELSMEFDNLRRASTPAQLKAQAKAMSGKL